MADNDNKEKDLTLEEEVDKIRVQQTARIAELEKKLAERDAMIKKYLTSGGEDKDDDASGADDETAYITAKAEQIKNILKKWRS